MTSCHGSPFNENSRIGSDKCSMSQRVLQNNAGIQYMMEGYNTDCPMSDAVGFATCQPAVNYSGSRQMGIGGCNVEYNSLLHLTSMTKDKCRVSLWQRPFLTVPYLGRGRTDNLVESNLRKGEEQGLSASSKSKFPTSEASYLRYTSTPLLPQLKSDISNSSRKIEEDASNGWVRGGMPSREYDRRTNYAQLGQNDSKHYNRARPWCGDSKATNSELKARYFKRANDFSRVKRQANSA